jgi:hypothetical protein
MFLRKLIVINMVVIYLTIKLYGLMWYSFLRSDSEKIFLLSDKLNCNLTEIFKVNDVLSSKFDQLRVSKLKQLLIIKITNFLHISLFIIDSGLVDIIF